MKYGMKENPAKTDGFSFLEFAAENADELRGLFTLMGFTHVANHKHQNVELWQQNDIVFLLNNSDSAWAGDFIAKHKAGTCGMGFYVEDVNHAIDHCLAQKAVHIISQEQDWEYGDKAIEVINGIADTRLYLTNKRRLMDTGLFVEIPGGLERMKKNSAGLQLIDHVTHNVYRGNMDKWANFYVNLFNFRQIRYFDIEGKLTGLFSRAMTSPCLKIRIPINESADDKSQIEEFLHTFNGEGIQHIALHSENIYDTVDKLKSLGMKFMKTPDTYYRKIGERLPYNPESVDALQKRQILVDGAPTKDGGYLLQIFTDTVIGPVFFEIIQRKGDEGFGEGNFQALFDSIELDQIERGVL